MRIVLTSKLKEYCHSKSYDSITLEKQMKKVCCASPPLPTVKVGKPKNQEDYHHNIIDGFHVYTHKEMRYGKPCLNIDLRKFFFIYDIYVYDPDTICICSGGQQYS